MNAVLVTFSDKSKDQPKFQSRRLTLSATTNFRQIGRSSSRYNADLSASPTNGWFDNAVMSREHAEIIWDSDTQLVSIRDTGSLHGTSLNGFQLPPWTKKRLQAGDVLRFGAPVEKELKAFHPTEVQISSIILGPPQMPLDEPRTITFTVPDESEAEEASEGVQVENIASDSEDGGVTQSAMLVQQGLFQPVQTPEKHTYPPTIDLTKDAQEDVLANEPGTPGANQSPATLKVDRTSTVTFAPALRYREPSSELTGLLDVVPSSPITVAQHTSEPERPQTTDSLIDDIIDDGYELSEGSLLLGVSVSDDKDAPSAPSTAKEHSGMDFVAEARRKIADRIAEELQQKSEHFPRRTVFQEDLAGLEQAQAAYCGQKRKFADFDLPEPKAVSPHVANLPAQPGTVNLAQLACGKTSGSAAANDRVVIGVPNGTSSAVFQPEPPRKRIRRVAEAVGYAALGGIAVMSALIATAPDL